MANTTYARPRHHIRPVDAFVAGAIGIVLGGAAILTSAFLPLAADLAYGVRLAGYLFLAVGATAAALAIVRQESSN